MSNRASYPPLLALENLTRIYGGVVAVQDVSLQVAAGERVGIIGPNGAGKTTLFRMIAGDIRPSSGSVRIGGQNVTEMSVQRRVKLGIGRTFQITNLFGTLTVRENLILAARQGPSLTWRNSTVDGVIKTFFLEGRLDAVLDSLSYGEQRRIELAVALCTGAKILLLDEPAAGLGPADREVMRVAIEALPRDLTILLIEHDIDLTLGIVDRVACLNYGQLVADDTCQDITNNPEVQRIYLGVRDRESS